MKNVYVITGGAGGIGLESAKAFKDDVVMIVDINDDALAAGKAELAEFGMDVLTFNCDISKKDKTDALAAAAAKLGKIRGVIHTAGVSGTVPNPKVVMAVDLVGTENIIESFYPYVEQDTVMVLTASMMGHTIPNNPVYDEVLLNCQAPDFMEKILPFLKDSGSVAYNFAKHGVHLLVQKWVGRYGAKGARINSISPGIIATKMALQAAEEHPEQMSNMEAITPLKRNGLPVDIKNAIAFLCSEEASFISGTDLLIDGGLVKTLMAASK